ncbi:MAG: trigger factor [Clostridia bacterium]|nr:trigger factor [Clostridia bacterium]
MSLVSANKTETNTMSIEIAVSAEDFKAAVQRSYLKNRKQITIPGFRKGKAPRPMIEKMYGSDFFYEDALEELFPVEIEAAYKEADIHPVDQPKDLDVKTMNIDEGLNFTVNVTVKPEITLKEYKGLKAEKEEVSVSDEEVDTEIKFMLDRGSRIVDVDNRPVQSGDITVIDFEGFVDGEAFEGGKAEKYNLTIGDGQFIPGFEDQIIGHSIGDEFDINVKFPDDYDEKLASKDAVFKIKLHEIKFKELPELDDEFAKDQDYDTVDEMKEGVKKDLLSHKEEQAQHRFEDNVVEKLCENVEGEIPEVMYDNKAQENVDSFARQVGQQGIDLDTYLMYMGTDKDTFTSMMRDRAVNDVKYELALEKIIELEEIKAAEEAVEEEYKKMADEYKIEIDRIKEIVPVSTVEDQLSRQAAAKLVIDSAEAVAPAPKAEEPAEEAKEN